MMDEAQVRAMLAARCEKLGSASAVAAEAGLSIVYVCDAVKGRRGIGPALLRYLGVEKASGYRKVKNQQGA